MLLGYALESRNGDWQGILPYDESSGLIAELAGHLAELLMRLDTWRSRLAGERTLAEWLPLCRELIDSFFSGMPKARRAAAGRDAVERDH